MSIVEKFDQAGLPLVISDKPIADSFRRGADKVFQMTKRDATKKRGEYFEMYLGAPDNKIEVVAIDKDFHQVVMTVKEPKRTFIISEINPETWKRETRTETTSAIKQNYLVGLDTTHLFIARLPKGASSVKKAHEMLDPNQSKSFRNSSFSSLTKKEMRKLKRQGEWFFKPVTAKEQEMIDTFDGFIKRKAPITGNTRNIHRVDELIEITVDLGWTKVLHMFARGKVRHPEHKTMVLKSWHSITKNMEVVERRRSKTVSRGSFWID